MPTVYGSITTRWDASSQVSGSGPTPTPTYLRRFAKHYGVSVTVMDGLGNYLPFGRIMDFAEQVDALFVAIPIRSISTSEFDANNWIKPGPAKGD